MCVGETTVVDWHLVQENEDKDAQRKGLIP